MFSPLDWSIIAAYLIFTFVVGSCVSRSAARSLDAYFVADRRLPWWWLGTSMAATTFAADTPLAVTGIVARDGITGNWFLWCSTLTYITVTVLFARRWRASGVLTDVELIELRYGGRAAGLLRAFKAFFLSILINTIVLGWVFRAMSKIARPFVRWESLIGPQAFVRVQCCWPGWLVIDNVDTTLTVLVILLVVVCYSSMGGLRGVVFTDLFQFVLAMGCALLLAVMAVRQAGGLPTLTSRLYELYPDRAAGILSFWPDFSNPLMPVGVFLIFIGVLWWAQYFSDGSGYLAQRINSARTPADAEKGSFAFTVLTFSLRSWPWIVVALAALVLFPLDDPARLYAVGAQVGADREMAYPVMMKLVLGPGLLGLVFVSLLAAFMSTVDTHINWAASYLVHDVYARFVRPAAPVRELIRVSRLCVIGIGLLAVAAAGQISSIEQAWKFFVAVGAGMGLPQMLRWVWWRVTAWTEIAGMSTALLTAVALYALFPDLRMEYLLGIVVAVSFAAAIVATFLSPAVERRVLERFVARARPVGCWPGFGLPPQRDALVRLALKWCAGNAAVFALLFGIGYLLLGSQVTGVGLLAAGTILTVAVWRSFKN